jgi:hypothetical protein
MEERDWRKANYVIPPAEIDLFNCQSMRTKITRFLVTCWRKPPECVPPGGFFMPACASRAAAEPMPRPAVSECRALSAGSVGSLVLIEHAADRPAARRLAGSAGVAVEV